MLITPAMIFEAHEEHAHNARQWRKAADNMAGFHPKFAARLRDVAQALDDLVFLACDMQREADRK